MCWMSRCCSRFIHARRWTSTITTLTSQLPNNANIYNAGDTIYALATAHGKAGIAVIRISGNKAGYVVQSMASSSLAKKILEHPRQLVYGAIRHPNTKDIVDRAMMVFSYGPHSFTGQDITEMHVHGGIAVVNSILDALGSVPGLRPAEAGEFTRRAFNNDKMDLTKVEAIADIINAETDAQRRLALRQANGELSRGIEKWRTDIIKCMSLVEAVVDFGEDEGIEDNVLDIVEQNLRKMRNEITSFLNDNRRGEILRNGIHVAVFGPPNAGKSSFLNILTRRKASIVSSKPGTTRDVIEVTLDIGGYPVVIADTAGIRDPKDEIEAIGIEMAAERVSLADLKICILDQNTIDNARDHDTLDTKILDLITEDTLIILNKVDLGRKNHIFSNQKWRWNISCKTNNGIPEFIDDFISILRDKFDTHSLNLSPITQARHRKHLQDCVIWLDEYIDKKHGDLVMAAEDLRYAATALGRISGHIDVEEVLDCIFREFCIGK